MSLDAGLIPAACFYFLYRTSRSPSHVQRHRMRLVGHVPKDGMPVGGQRALFSDQNEKKSHVVDKERSAATFFVLLAHHPERSNRLSQRNTARNVSYATGAAALSKIHGADRAHWLMACRDRVLCATARAACVGLTRASAPAGFGFEAPTSNCAWEALLMAPTEPGKPRTQPRLAATTARKARFGHFFNRNNTNLCYCFWALV